MQETIETCYDRQRDVLFGSVRPDRRLQSDPVAVDLFLLRDAATGEVAGLECLDFSLHVGDSEWMAALPDIAPFYDLRAPSQRLPLAQLLRQVWRSVHDQGLTAGEPALAVAHR